MTSHQKIMLSLSRLPRGARFIPLGRSNRPIIELQGDVRKVHCSFLELHAADGMVRGFAPQDLAELRRPYQDGAQPAFLIGFSADQHASLAKLDQRPNLYRALEADEALSEAPDHRPRFLPPSALQRRLHTRGVSLNPDDYAHRLSELDEAAANAPDGDIAAKIQRFRNVAAKYRMAVDDKVPEGKFYTTDRSCLAEDATRMPCEVMPCPAEEEPNPASSEKTETLACDENAPLPTAHVKPVAEPSRPASSCSKPDQQFTLAL